ncbi:MULTISPECIES: ferredoxin--NADP reductase [Burkholderia]|uniref:ferredoxin--NADP reductase n=1 Tax=Burkholderia TaxID=32008 RepID=UPI000756CEC1|nr:MULTISPECIES: ferredoxin--NADP reductase [Burkholderia]AOJ68467.1 ferredoxin--NADP(+) reductase [Burkholderia savannae]AOK46689.1 ferredoxin--NADP(+) reductase [Burkholderia sp. MSMB617WGS]KVG46630.1 ferredoxin--NADP(+) reductase [Burkholderia sp. MSMB0265]KVG87305.1 ferredoxin--NADP(+) reductase [Burkholderia sp. MSMB2040]KVG99959.1 ferredoxin--NADP(+) reductase [Burkholderia sp. MSMB2041]
MSANAHETVLSVHHWNDTLFSFKTTRNPSLRFKTGQFVMIGLEIEGKPLMRAYSVVSAYYDDYLEFYSIKVPDGPLTSRLQHLRVGDTLLVGRKPTGSLIIDNLRPGRHLYLLSTGTGLAPFISVIRDPEYYEAFDKIVLTHGVRWKSELGYFDHITSELPENEYFGDLVRDKLIYYPTVTRETFERQGRLTELIDSGKLFDDIGLPPFDSAVDRAMICGSPSMLADLVEILARRGFVEGTSHAPGDYVIERAFVEK